MNRSVGSDQECRHAFEKDFHIAEKQVLLVLKVSIKGSSICSGTVENLLQSNPVEYLFCHECNQRVSKDILCLLNAGVHTGWLLRSIAGSVWSTTEVRFCITQIFPAPDSTKSSGTGTR